MIYFVPPLNNSPSDGRQEDYHPVRRSMIIYGPVLLQTNVFLIGFSHPVMKTSEAKWAALLHRV